MASAEEGFVAVVHGSSERGSSRGSEREYMFRRGLVVACVAGAAACIALVAGGGGHSGRWSELRALDTANLPSYTAASLALRTSVKDTEALVNMQAKAHGNHALGNKALLKIEAAARAAALASNSKLREADIAIAESQKALGTNAVHLKLLTGTSTGNDDDNEPLSSAQLAALIEHSRTDSDASKALAAAKAAAAKNKMLMEGARDIIAQASKALGKDAVAIPALGEPKGAVGGHREKMTEKEADAHGREEFLADRRFLHATKAAFMRP